MTKIGSIVRLSLIAFVLTACAATYQNHGYAPTDAELSEVIVGVDTRETVADVIGRPTSGGVLNGSGYYYVHSRWKHFAYRAPEVIERQVVAVTFDDNGVVENIERFGLEEGRVVALSRRVTDSNIKGISFLRQLLGNLGNFDASSAFNRD